MKWNDLSMKDRATLILLGVASGVYDIGTIKDTYNSYAEGGKLYEDGGDTNLVKAANEYRKGGPVDFSYRSEYLKKDKKLVKYLTDKAIEYGVNPYLVLDRIAKEGLVDNLIRKKASISWLSDGEERYTQAFGEIGLDDVYANAQKGVYKFHRPIPIVEEKRVNEKGRTVSSGIFNNKYDALEAYVADLAYRQGEMLKKYPHLSKDDLDALTSASYNMGLSGALKAYENNGNYKKYNILQHIKSIPLDYTSINEEFAVPLSYKDFGALITPGRSGFMIRHGKGKNYSYPISDVSKALYAIGLSDYTNDRLDYYLIPNSSELKNKLDQFLNLLKIDLLNPQPNKNQLNILLDIYDYATEKIINYNPDYVYNNPYANLSNDLVKKNGGLLNSVNLYLKGGKLQNALYWLLSHSGGGTQLGGLQYTGSYSYPNHTSILKRGNIIQTVDSSEFGGDNAVSSRDLVSLYLGLDTLGVNKLRHDTYRIGNLAYDVDFFDGKLLPLKKNKDQTYNIPQRIKTELDDLIKTDRPIKANFNALPKDTVTFAPQVLDNIQHGYIKPFIDDLGNYNLRVSKYWNLKHSLPGGKIVEDVSSGSPFVLEQIVPIRFVNSDSTPEWNAILQIKSTK